jgi:hypothetical protein
MESSDERSAALLITVYRGGEGGGRWYARVLSYQDAFARETSCNVIPTIDRVCMHVRRWLTATVTDPPRDATVTQR